MSRCAVLRITNCCAAMSRACFHSRALPGFASPLRCVASPLRLATPLTCSRLMTQALTGQAAFSNRDAPNGQQQQQPLAQQQHHQLGAGGSGGGGGARPVDQLLYGPTSGSRGGGPGAVHPVAAPAATSDPRPAAAMFGLAPSGGFLSTGTPSAGSFSRTSYHSAGGQPPSPHDGGGGSSFHRTSLHAQSPSPHSQTASPMAGGTPAMVQSAASLPQSHWATQAAAAAAASRPPSAAVPPQAPSQAPHAGAPGLGTLATEPAAATSVKLQQHPTVSGPAAAEQGPPARGPLRCYKCHAAHVPLIQRMAAMLYSRSTVQSCRSRSVCEVVRTGRSE